LFVLLFVHAYASEAMGNWNPEKGVGPSKFYKELEDGNFKKKVFRDDADVVVVFYSDHCELCHKLHGEQEKVAEKITKLTKKIVFHRIDEVRMGGVGGSAGTNAGFSKLKASDFKDGEIPKMYFVKAGEKKPIRIPHGDIGWTNPGKGNKGRHKLFNWIKETSSFGEELQGKKKKNEKGEKTEL